MNSFRYDYAVIGGDMRQIYLAKELAEANRSVCCHALCQPVHVPSLTSVSLETALGSSATVVCPIPFSRDGIFLNQSGIKKSIPLKQIFMTLKPEQTLFAGSISKELCRLATEKNISVFDFMQDTALAHFNSIATAEGVICEAIKTSPINLHKSRCAVLGYGKCGSILTDDLKRLFCYVTTVSSVPKERAQAALYADQTLDLRAFLLQIDEYDFIFNTIPSITLTKEALTRVKPSAVILDIASSPGGVDFTAAKELSVTALSCLGLPGRYAPLSSAKAIKSSMDNFMRKMRVPT